MAELFDRIVMVWKNNWIMIILMSPFIWGGLVALLTNGVTVNLFFFVLTADNLKAVKWIVEISSVFLIALFVTKSFDGYTKKLSFWGNSHMVNALIISDFFMPFGGAVAIWILYDVVPLSAIENYQNNLAQPKTICIPIEA